MFSDKFLSRLFHFLSGELRLFRRKEATFLAGPGGNLVWKIERIKAELILTTFTVLSLIKFFYFNHCCIHGTMDPLTLFS
jgi:hypothetical protein